MNKKKLILTIITFVLFVVVFVLACMLFNKYILKFNFEKDILSFAEKNDKVVFYIDKIVFFSSCDSKNKTDYINNFTIDNLNQYTDLAIYINNQSTDEINSENTLKRISISNIQFNKKPELGNAKLFFKSINNFAKSDFKDTDEITDSLDFDITSQDKTNLDFPTLYNNLANPITLSYVNQNIKSNYQITDISIPLSYDGSLLKRCNVDLSSISCNLSFDINITNNLDENFKSSVFIDIPLEINDKSIYDGNISFSKNVNFIFYRF